MRRRDRPIPMLLALALTLPACSKDPGDDATTRAGAADTGRLIATGAMRAAPREHSAREVRLLQDFRRTIAERNEDDFQALCHWASVPDGPVMLAWLDYVRPLFERGVYQMRLEAWPRSYGTTFMMAGTEYRLGLRPTHMLVIELAGADDDTGIPEAQCMLALARNEDGNLAIMIPTTAITAPPQTPTPPSTGAGLGLKP